MSSRADEEIATSTLTPTSMMRSAFTLVALLVPTTHAFVASTAPRPLIKTTTTVKQPQIAVQQLRGGTVQASIPVPPTVLGATALRRRRAH